MVVFKKVNVGIVGHTGAAGKELKKLLQGHPFVELVYTESSKKSRGKARQADLMFVATHGEVSRVKVPGLLRDGKVVIDFSREYRLGRGSGYGRAVYGLPEKNRAAIRGAQFIANPGCYATSVELALLAIMKHLEGVTVDAESGVSGKGEPSIRNGGMEPYETGRVHDHVKEMERVLGIRVMDFVPKRVWSLERGIISTIRGELKEKVDISELIGEYYRHERFVRIKKIGSTSELVGTNYCDLELAQDGKAIRILSALDNLMKGAAGQAVQNMNVRCGFDEATGLV